MEIETSKPHEDKQSNHKKGFIRRVLSKFNKGGNYPNYTFAEAQEKLYVALQLFETRMELKRQGKLLNHEIESSSERGIRDILSTFEQISGAIEALKNGQKVDDETEGFRFKIKDMEIEGTRATDNSSLIVTKKYSRGDLVFTETVTLSPTLIRFEKRRIKKDANGNIILDRTYKSENKENTKTKVWQFSYALWDYRDLDHPLPEKQWTPWHPNSDDPPPKRIYPWDKNNI